MARRYVALIGYPQRAVLDLNRAQDLWIEPENQTIYKQVLTSNDVRGIEFDEVHIYSRIDKIHPRTKEEINRIVQIIRLQQVHT